jgi:hypothetical protein
MELKNENTSLHTHRKLLAYQIARRTRGTPDDAQLLTSSGSQVGRYPASPVSELWGL